MQQFNAVNIPRRKMKWSIHFWSWFKWKERKKTDFMRVQSFCIKKIKYSSENPKMVECLMARSVIIHFCWEITLQNNTRKFSHKRPSHSRDIWMVFNLLPSFIHSLKKNRMWGAFTHLTFILHYVWFIVFDSQYIQERFSFGIHLEKNKFIYKV